MADVPDDVIIKAALEHDLDEIIVGDIPSPTKARAKEHGFDFSDLWDGRKHHDRMSYIEAWILKAADIIESLWFITMFACNGHGRIVRDQLENRLKEHTEQYTGPGGITFAGNLINDILYKVHSEEHII